MKRRVFSSLLVAGLLASSQVMALAGDGAADYPNQPIKIVVDFPAGGTVDTLARLIGEKLSKKWGQPVVVYNRPGAGGNIGAAYAYNSDPDGYTLLATPPGPLAINENLYSRLQYQPEKFVPVALLCKIPNMIAARAGFPADSLKDLIAYAKAHPGKVSFASQGNGSTSHLSGQLLSNMAGISMTHIPYKGEGPALLDLVAGRVDLFIGNISALVKYKQDQKVKFFGVASDHRSPVAPDTPTAAQAGLPGFEASAWFALAAPPNTPPAIAQKLNDAVNEALKMPDVQKMISSLGGEIEPGTPQAMEKFVDSERKRWKDVIKAAGVTVG